MRKLKVIGSTPLWSTTCQTGALSPQYPDAPGAPVVAAIDRVFQAGLGCAKGLMGGLWDSTGGLVLSVFDGRAWGAMKDTWNGIKLLCAGFSKVISENYRGFRKLPFDIQVKIFCDFIGIAAGTLFTTIMTDGVLAIYGGTTAWGRLTIPIRAALAGMETHSKFNKELRSAKTPQNRNCSNTSPGINGAANKARLEQIQTGPESGDAKETEGASPAK